MSLFKYAFILCFIKGTPIVKMYKDENVPVNHTKGAIILHITFAFSLL